MNHQAPRRAQAALVASIVGTVILYWMPMGDTLAYPLVLLSTLAHELGHGLAAIMVGCSFDQFVLYSDGSGAAITSGNPGRFASALISAGGLVGPAIAGAGCFVVGRRGNTARTALLLVGLMLLCALVLLIRNLFGWVFVGSVAGICLWAGLRGSAQTAQLAVVFIGVQLALSVFSRSDYLFTSMAQTSLGPQPSDVAHMANALFLPYWVWGLLCGALSVGVLGLGVSLFLRDSAR